MNASRDREKVKEKITQILLRLELIEKQQDKVMADLRKYLNERIDNAVQQFSEYLSSEDVKGRFTTWTLDEVPKAGERWLVTERLINRTLSSRLRQMIDEWEEDNEVLTKACHDLLQHFKQRYNLVEGQLQNLQVTVTAEGLVKKYPSCSLARSILGVSNQRTILFFVIPLTDLYILLKDWLRNKAYVGDECAQMAKRSADLLTAATQRDKLYPLVQEQFKQAKLYLKQIESRIPELIQADKMLYEELIAQTRTQKEMKDLCQPIINEGSQLRGQLLVFGIKEVCFPDISEEELDWKEDAPSRLGCGGFGAVYQGTIRRNKDVEQVALKFCRDVLDAQNV